VQQSPYLMPDGLEDALKEFDLAFDSEEYFETNCRDLLSKIRLAFDKCPRLEQCQDR
jgi:hypothetical protein